MNSRTRVFQRACAIAIVAVGASPSWAGVNQWTVVGPPGGGVTKVAYNPTTPTTVYLFGVSGFYRSTNGGTNWTPGNLPDPPYDMAVDPSNGSRVYVATEFGPFLSIDAGASFTRMATFPLTEVGEDSEMAVSQDGMTLYFATSDMLIFRSIDRGQTWQERTPIAAGSNPFLIRVAIDPADPATLYAVGTAAGVYSLVATHDSAGTWASADPNHLVWPTVRDITFNPAIPRQVWVAAGNGLWNSSNQGVLWTHSPSSPRGARVVFDPAANGVIYASGDYGFLWRSPDTGATWNDISGTTTLHNVTTFAVNPTQSSVVLAGGDGGLISTANSGATWSPQEAGIAANSIVAFSADAASDRIYINASAGGIHSLSGGASASVTTPINDFALEQLDTYPHWSSPTAIFAQQGSSAVPGQLLVSLSTGIARSSDAGATWSLTSLPAVPNDQINADAIKSSPRNQQVILASVPGSIFRSTDGGASFTAYAALSGLPTNAYFVLLASSPTDASVFYIAPLTQASPTAPIQEYGLYRSTDAGMSWTGVNTGLGSSSIRAITVDPTNAQVVYVSTDAALMKSTNGGNSWSPVNWDAATFQSPAPGPLAIDPGDPRVLFALSARIGRSVDGGNSWQPLILGQQPPAWITSALILDPNRPSRLLVGTARSGVQELTVAPDLALQGTAPTTTLLAAGNPAAYSYVVSNNGTYDASGVVLTISFPATATAVTASVNPSAAGSCTPATGGVTCTFNVLRAAASATVSLSVTPAEGAFRVSAALQGEQPDSDTTNNSVASSNNAALPTDLSVTVSGASTAQVGDTVSYTVTVSNAGANAATSSQLTFQAAAGLTLTGAIPSTGSCTTDAPSGKVTCALGDIAASQAVSVIVKATAAAAGSQVSTTTVTTTRMDAQSNNNTASATTTTAAAPANNGGGSSGGGASGGGRGALSVYWLLALTGLLLFQQQRKLRVQAISRAELRRFSVR